MQFEVEKLSDIQRKISFSIPAADVESELQHAYDRLKRRTRIPGFRPGKVPRNILEHRYGTQVEAEVANRFFQQAFNASVKDMTYFGQPKVETDGLKGGSTFSFHFILEVEPELAVSSYKGLEVVYPHAAVSDAQLESRVNARLQSRASLHEVTAPRPAQRGDAVMVELDIQGPDGQLDYAPGAMLKIGEEAWYKGLDLQMIGRSVGEDFTLDFTFPESAGNSLVAGRAAQISGKILSLQELRAPELSDEVAAELGYEGGAEAMRAAIRAQIQERADEAARNQARANLLQKLVNANLFDVPKALVEQFFEALMQELQLQQYQAGRDVRQTRFSDAEVEDLRTRARFAARASLILKHIAQVESLNVSDDELDTRLQQIADLRDQRVEAIKAYLQQENAFGQLRERILEEKTLDWLLEQSDLKTPAPAEAAPAPVEAAPPAALPEPEVVIAEAAPAEAAPAEEAPKKKSRSKKAVEAAPAEEAAPAVEAAPAEAAEEKPKKKSRSKKAAEEPE